MGSKEENHLHIFLGRSRRLLVMAESSERREEERRVENSKCCTGNTKHPGNRQF
jgi:hypothetical protein